MWDRISFSRLELVEMGLRSFAFAFPGFVFVGSLRVLCQEVNPQFAKRDLIHGVDPRAFIITGYNEDLLKRVAKLFVEKLPESLRSTALEDRYVNDLKDFRAMVLRAAQVLKCERIDIGFSFSDSSKDLSMDRYMAFGGQAISYFSKPFMSFHLNASIEAENLEGGARPLSIKAKDFVSAHEVSHITSNHTLVQAVVSFVYGFFNVVFWRQCWNKDYSLLVVLGVALIAAFIFQLFFFTFLRHQEKQADLMACDVLESNEGAIEYFQTERELSKEKPDPLDLSHPPILERIAYVKRWKKEAESLQRKLD